MAEVVIPPPDCCEGSILSRVTAGRVEFSRILFWRCAVRDLVWCGEDTWRHDQSRTVGNQAWDPSYLGFNTCSFFLWQCDPSLVLACVKCLKFMERRSLMFWQNSSHQHAKTESKHFGTAKPAIG